MKSAMTASSATLEFNVLHQEPGPILLIEDVVVR
jgi:hypothetical protein